MRRPADIPRCAALAAALFAAGCCGQAVGDPESETSSSGSTSNSDPCAAPAWARTFGSDDGTAMGLDVVVDASCNTIVVGTFRGTIDLGDGPLFAAGPAYELYAAKLDPSGKALWSKRFGTVEFYSSASVALDAEQNIVLAGSFEGEVDFGGGPLASVGSAGNAYVAKLDAGGGHLWSRRYGDGHPAFGDQPRGVAVDASGNVIVGGWFSGEIDFGDGPLDAGGVENGFLAKLAPSGDALWTAQIESPQSARVNDLAVDGSGAITFTGSFEVSTSLGFTNTGDDDAYVARYDPDGAMLWAQHFGGVGNESGQALAVDVDGNVAVGGSFTQEIDFGQGPHENESDVGLVAFAARLDPGGSVTWADAFETVVGPGPSFGQRVGGVALGDDGQLWLTGQFSGKIDFGGELLTAPDSIDAAFIAVLDADGALLGQRALGGLPSPTNNGSVGLGIALDPAGTGRVTGAFVGKTDFGDGPVTAAGDVDGFIAKMSF